MCAVLHFGVVRVSLTTETFRFPHLLICGVCVSAKLVPVGYGIKKLQISCVVEDDKVSTDDLEDQITALEDYVSKDQSVY